LGFITQPNNLSKLIFIKRVICLNGGANGVNGEKFSPQTGLKGSEHVRVNGVEKVCIPPISFGPAKVSNLGKIMMGPEKKVNINHLFIGQNVH
jgi:hypothetical protein